MEITFRHDPRPVARYVSATTVREEALEKTRLVGLYWSASGQVQRENVAAGLPGVNALEFPVQTFELEIDGQSLCNRWEWVHASERAGVRPGTREAVIELRHQVRPIDVKVVTRLDGTPFLVRYLEITNTGTAPAALAAVSPWSGLLWMTQENTGMLPPGAAVFTLGYLDSNRWGSEGNFTWETLPRGTRRISSTLGRSGYGAPYFLVRNEVTGECAIGALAWSGNWYMEFWQDPARTLEGGLERGCNLAFRMGPLAPAPQRVIAPGETVTSPEMHLAMLHAGLDECVDALHQHITTSVLPPRPPEKGIYTIAGRVVEEPGAWILNEIDIAAEMGVQAFMVDAGWYGDQFGGWWERRGDWWEGDWITGGLAACRERAHRHGMKFGLWMEPESMGTNSRLLQEHPEWALTTDVDTQVTHNLNLADPQAAQFFSESILRVIREQQLDFYKIDYNDPTWEGGQHVNDGFAENEHWRHYEVLYAAYDRVRQQFPELLLENCAGGGGRLDLGMLSRFHYGCESDMSAFPRSIRAINGLTMFLPPEALVYYHNHLPHAHQLADLRTHLRVALFARTIFVGFGAQDADRSTEYYQLTRRYIQLAKEFAYPLLDAHPRVYHHTPAIGSQGPAGWCVLEYAARDRSRGYTGLFRLGAAPSDDYRFTPRGLSPSRRYRVTFDNLGESFELPGAEMMLHGLPVRLDGVCSSEVVMFEGV